MPPACVAQAEAIGQGCDQVVFLDAVEHRYVEELGGMNIFFVFDDGSIATPPLGGTILPGITRAIADDARARCGDHGARGAYRSTSGAADADSGRLREAFACGTAAVVTPGRSRSKWDGGATPDVVETGPVTHQVRQALVDIQFGRADDTFGWMHRVC